MIPPLRLATRTFLISILPVCLALGLGFFAIRSVIEERAKAALRVSFHRTESALESMRSEYQAHNRRLVSILSENAALKAGIGLLKESVDRAQIRRTIEDQLREFAGSLNYDLILVVAGRDQPVAGLVRDGKMVSIPDLELVSPVSSSLFEVQKVLYDVATVPVNLGSENIGSLTVGKVFDIRGLNELGHAVLTRNGKILMTTFSKSLLNELERGIAAVLRDTADEYELNLNGETYLALPMSHPGLGAEYRLLSFQSATAATAWFIRDVRQAFTWVGGCALIAVLFLSGLGARSVARPLTELISHLGESERTGELKKDFQASSGTLEVNQLARAFNRAADAILQSQQDLDQAYLEFIDTMAQALDARDPYTAGHSQRVAEYSIQIAMRMGLPPDQVEILRNSARFHDIGKIGVPDAVLQKPGRLTSEEFELIKRHPLTGKRILEKVERFKIFIPSVELHHEDHNGRGYPYGLRGEEIPLLARIVKVADAYDAMTTDRAYRNAMSREQAIQELQRCSGTQFDPEVAQVFLSILEADRPVEEPQYAAIS